MALTGKQITMIIIDDPMMEQTPKFNRVKKFPLTWKTCEIDQAWAHEECDRLKALYPEADIKVVSYYGDYRVRIVFDDEADEAEFIMRESI